MNNYKIKFLIFYLHLTTADKLFLTPRHPHRHYYLYHKQRKVYTSFTYTYTNLIKPRSRWLTTLSALIITFTAHFTSRNYLSECSNVTTITDFSGASTFIESQQYQEFLWLILPSFLRNCEEMIAFFFLEKFLQACRPRLLKVKVLLMELWAYWSNWSIRKARLRCSRTDAIALRCY